MSAARPLHYDFDRNQPDPHTPPIPLRFRPEGPAAALLRRQQLQEQAFTLFGKGCRSPEIAPRLGVAERTVRAWLRQMRQEIAADPAFDSAGQLIQAVEGLREVLQAAWQAFEEDRAAQESLLAGQLDYLRKRVVTSDRSDPTGKAQTIIEDYTRPRFTSHAPTCALPSGPRSKWRGSLASTTPSSLISPLLRHPTMCHRNTTLRQKRQYLLLPVCPPRPPWFRPKFRQKRQYLLLPSALRAPSPPHSTPQLRQ